ncbi:hypothetical protein HanPI659440_Chr15g0595471 [Helianthus annuus]|nr:hypothetical protein HanPI659440_Chr15g0595471 [Helianthus annuus]
MVHVDTNLYILLQPLIFVVLRCCLYDDKVSCICNNSFCCLYMVSMFFFQASFGLVNMFVFVTIHCNYWLFYFKEISFHTFWIEMAKWIGRVG